MSSKSPSDKPKDEKPNVFDRVVNSFSNLFGGGGGAAQYSITYINYTLFMFLCDKYIMFNYNYFTR